MSENPIAISNLNDFIFCPVSIYFHGLDISTETMTYQEPRQINGTAAHSAVDNGNYSDKKNILQSIDVYSEKYNLYGKIDIFDTKSGVLTERKKKISKIYDGYIFQLYAQYFALCEMGFTVNKIRFHSIDDNKNYDIALPQDNREMYDKFVSTIENMKNFDFEGYRQDNALKCRNCIYAPMCSYSVTEEDMDAVIE